MLSTKIATNRRPTPTYVMARRYQQVALPSRSAARYARSRSSTGCTTSTSAPEFPQAGRDLHRAARVRAGHDPDPRVADGLGLLSHQRPGHLRLEHVVEAGGAAAAVAVLDLHDLGAGDLPEHRSRLAAGCPGRAARGTRRGRRRAFSASSAVGVSARPEIVQERHQVMNGERRPLDELAVVLHVCAASRGVHDHVIDARERRRVAAREPCGPCRAVRCARRAPRSSAALGGRPRASRYGPARGSWRG